jgi:hypothetical protein
MARASSRDGTAHHSLSVEFDTDKTVTLTGSITEMKWSNPHGWLYIDVKDAKGEIPEVGGRVRESESALSPRMATGRSSRQRSRRGERISIARQHRTDQRNRREVARRPHPVRRKQRQAITTRVKLVLALTVSLAFTTAASAQQYRAPRTPDGQPDLQGIWQAVNTAVWNIQDHSASLGVPAGQGIVDGNEIPYRQEALAKRLENYRNRTTDDPERKCYMVGTPRILYMPYPFQIVQTRNQIAIISEYVHTVRSIRLGGQHPAGSVQWWMG